MKSLRLRAFAKLNLFLELTGRRSDGYHEIRTVMQSVSLCDELEFTLTDGTGIEIFCDRQDLPTDGSNLVYKGIMAVLDYGYFSPGCKITVNLKKHIPSGAGMGGGSADCAAAIVAMNELFHVGLDEQEMRTAAAMCGADVPFCISGGTALCEGIGERITPLATRDDLHFAVVKPALSIPTADAYKKFDEKGSFGGGGYENFAKAYLKGDARTLGGTLYNAFSAACEYEEIAEIKGKLLQAGALGAEMTGSGSAVFGIFSDGEAARQAAKSCGCEFGGAYTAVDKGVEIF